MRKISKERRTRVGGPLVVSITVIIVMLLVGGWFLLLEHLKISITDKVQHVLPEAFAGRFLEVTGVLALLGTAFIAGRVAEGISRGLSSWWREFKRDVRRR
ncbi:MAG: hypothetical protein ABII12_08535 [Planctomycetota bacterium]